MAQRNHDKVRQFTDIMLAEQQTFKERSLNYNLVEAIVELQTGSRLQDLKIVQLKKSNKRLWIFISTALSLLAIAAVINLFIYQRKKYKTRIRHADEQVASLVRKLNQSNLEKEKIAQEIQEFLAEKDNRQELETLTPYMLKESETKFRHCFELLYPLLLPRLRERVPSISRREELLSMLIALKQDNKVSAELLGIAPRSVLMLRHRFRQKIGIASEYSLENFIEDLLN
jgi:DNA-binding CsgD family transcriptional regulator